MLSYLHSDHLGSTILTTNGSGATTGDNHYYGYGRRREGSEVVTESRFTGQKLDGTGLQYFNARYYDPELGTFISPDTIVPDAGNLFDYNRYMYARGNPLKFNDPSGHCATLDGGAPDMQGDGQCWGLAYSIYGYGATGSDTFSSDWKIGADQWLQDIATQSYATADYLTPLASRYASEWEGNVGLTSYVANPTPAPPTAYDCSKVDCTTLLINRTVVGLDLVSLYASGGSATAQGVAFSCGLVGILPCAVAAEGVAGTLGSVSTVASLAGTGLTAIQVARGKADSVDLAVSA